jgi:predicted Zn-dependent protease
MFSWGCIGEDAIRQGTSPLSQLRQAVKEGVAKTRFSDQFHLFEDFKLNPLPRFNERGEVAPERMELIVAGELKNTWISARSAKEYGIQSNSASSSETLRAPVLAGGTLAEQDALQTLGSGVYLPNLHYLNWSDQSAGRITGMTRHACVWVENGVPVAPIENMRWDDTLFRVFGSELEALTREQTSIPDTSSYEFRSIGGLVVPGALLRSFRFVS